MMDIKSIKPGEIVKIIHPNVYRYSRDYTYVAWPNRIRCVETEKTCFGEVKYYESKTPFIVDLEGVLKENSTFGCNTRCTIEKVTYDEYVEISKLLRDSKIRYNRKLNKITYSNKKRC